MLPHTIDIEIENRLLKVCYVPATSAASSKAFLLHPFTVLMRQTRQAVHAIKQSIFLDVYALYPPGPIFLHFKSTTSVYQRLMI
jgi:hypothetical protein